MPTKPAEQIDAVACAAITDEVSVTIAHYEDGWGFFSWSSAFGESLTVAHLNADDLARRFATPREAIDHCRAVYDQRLRLAPPPDAPADPELQRIGRRVRYQITRGRKQLSWTHEVLRRARQRLNSMLKRGGAK